MATELHAPPLNGINGDHVPFAADSPQTPVNTQLVDDVKIDIDPLDSDVRDDPVPIKPALVSTFSMQPELGSPVEPDSIPIHVPNGTPPPPAGQLLPEVEMAEQLNDESQHDDATPVDLTFPPSSRASDGSLPNGDAPSPTMETSSPMDAEPHMNGDAPAAAPATNGVDIVVDAPPPNLRRSADEMEADEHPAKRARVNEEGEHDTRPHSVAPATNGHTESAPFTTFSAAQYKFSLSTVRTLKKMRDASPFLKPVDPVALNIPHYTTIVKTPMDFSTVERKLASSNPAKPDPNPENPRYHNSDEFVADVRLMFSNSVLFNGPEHAVAQMGKRVEAVFDKQIKQIPPPDEPKPIIKKVEAPTPPPAPVAAVKKTVRRPSVPSIRRNEADTVSARPKREIHPPPPKDLPYAEPPKKPTRKVRKPKDANTLAQLQFCSKVMGELHKKQHWAIAHPFYDPVNWQELNLPDYPKVVKKPMDLATMRKKLDAHEYSTSQKFYDDFKLMIRNCFAYNPAGTPVNQAGIELQRLFDEKWKALPGNEDDSDVDEEEDDSEDERARAIADMENEIAIMRDRMNALKGVPKPKKEKKKEKREKYAAPVASTSKAPAKSSKGSAPKKKPAPATTAKKPVTDDDVLSFDQKKELSEAISALEGNKLEKVIQIIHEGVPEIRDSTEEIELEIDTLPAAVLTKLYNFVIRPLKAGPKRSRVPKGGGTGGLQRKSMDEDVEAEKIRQLEERMRLFEEGQGHAAGAAPPVVGQDSDGSSDSSSDDSSDSE